jgi:hypothetical protein
MALAGITIGAGWAVQQYLLHLLCAHQRSVTTSLAEWGKKYSNIQGPDDAGRARQMLSYIEGYYVVAPGYKSDTEMDDLLESQRRETLGRINSALQRYELEQSQERVHRAEFDDSPN